MKDYSKIFMMERCRLNLSEREVASGLNIWQRTLHTKETGEKEFSVYELYKAYTKFGIDVGFAEVFDYIDKGRIKELINEVQKDNSIEGREFRKALDIHWGEMTPVYRRQYIQIKLETAEKVKKIILYCKSERNNRRTQWERKKEKEKIEVLLGIIEREDGNLKRAIEILEAEVNSGVFEQISEFVQSNYYI